MDLLSFDCPVTEFGKSEDVQSSRRVRVANSIEWDRDYSELSIGQLTAMDADEIATVDPLALNLVVARGIPSLAGIEIGHYQQTVNEWTRYFRDGCLPQWELSFYDAPESFKHDLRYFRLGMICQFVDVELGIRYNLAQRDLTRIRYTNPNDLFLCGLIDTREGTCGNMSALHVAIAWRMGWPVSMASVGTHFIARYDDGSTTFNIEATHTGRGGWSSRSDEDYIEEFGVTARSLSCGCELRALSPREMLGVFVGLRARHVHDVGKERGSENEFLKAESDWLLSRHLHPADRIAFRTVLYMSLLRGKRMFESNELDSPIQFARDVLAEHAPQQEFTKRASGRISPQISTDAISEDLLDSILGATDGDFR